MHIYLKQQNLKQRCNEPRCSILGQASVDQRQSLIPQTLHELESNKGYQKVLKRTAKQGQQALTREERRQRQRSLDNLGCPSFYAKVKQHDVAPLVRGPCRVLQLNIGLYCNQACTHCHVESSPLRTEMMDRRTAQRCVELMDDSGVETVDITGGAPELNEQFRYLVEAARAKGLEVIDRCNLTVLLEPGQEGLVDFLAGNSVRVVASLPCYSQANVDKQRGSSVFDRSIQALQLLNNAGYGKEGSGLILDLLYNPGGAFLAPEQTGLQRAYKEELWKNFGIEFNSLFCLNNMPIKRYVDWLQRRDQLGEYMQLLVDNFNPGAAQGIMCKDTVSVGWDGRVYDCDFNQQLALPINAPKHTSPSQSPAGAGAGEDGAAGGEESGNEVVGVAGPSVWSIQSLADLTGLPIACDNHCFGCTAGAGSSCQGATS